MADTIYLVGSEEVRSAGHTIQRAAEDMQHAAGTFAAAAQQHRQFLDDWLERLAGVLEADRKERQHAD